MKILITGVSGFVGEYLADYLLKKHPKDEIFGLERNIVPFRIFPKLNKLVKFFCADITDIKNIKKIIKKLKPDQVYHLAGFASGAGKDKDLIFKVNVEGTVNILQALSDLQEPVKILLASTAYVYGSTLKCAKENSPLVGKSYYDQSKIKMEKEAKKFASKDLSIVITRATNHTGPGQRLGFVVPDFSSQIAKAHKGGEILVGNLGAKRDIFDVRDCVRAYHIVMKKGLSGEIYNIGTGQVISIKEILEKLIKLSNEKISYVLDHKRLRPSDIIRSCINPTKINRLGWYPGIDFNRTLKNTLKYWQENVKMGKL